MKTSDKWLGYFGGGGSASILGGASLYQINLWSMSGGPVPMPVQVMGTRLGIMAQAEFGHAFCLLIGIQSPSDFTEIKSQGLDWCLNIGGNVSSSVKTLESVWDILIKSATLTGNWAASESAKKAVQILMGDLSLDDGKPKFLLITSPVSIGIGGGIFYEWQSLTKVGSDVAWRYIEPNWWLQQEGNRVTVHMSSIPEPDGARLGIQVRRQKFGADDVMVFEMKYAGMSNGRHTNKLKTINGAVYGGRLCDPFTKNPGLELSSLKPAGILDVGIFTTTRDSQILINEDLRIGLSITRSAQSETNLYKWSSKNYAPVTTNSDGYISRSSDSRKLK